MSNLASQPTTGTALLTGVAAELAEKIKSHTAVIGVVGLGYVGLPLAVEFAQAGFHVVGIDLSESKCASVNAGESYIGDIPTSVLAHLDSLRSIPTTWNPACANSTASGSPT